MSKIMIVEDNKNIIKVLEICLNKAGYEIKAVTNGLKAVELALEWQPDLILLDITIPKMNGFLVCEALRDEGSQIPIVMLSAKSEEADIKKAYQLGANDYIVKPVQPKELLAKIDKNLKGGSSNE